MYVLSDTKREKDKLVDAAEWRRQNALWNLRVEIYSDGWLQESGNE